MTRTGPPSSTRRQALLGGVVALLGTAAIYWQSSNELSLGPILVGALVAGYLHDGDRSSRRRLGVGVGLIGGLPAVWLLADVLGALSGLGGPPWFRVVATGLGIGSILTISLLAFGLAAVTGIVGAAVGDWLSRKTGRRRSPTAGN